MKMRVTPAYPFNTLTQRSSSNGRFYRGFSTSELRRKLKVNATVIGGAEVFMYDASLVRLITASHRDIAIESYRLAKELRRREVNENQAQQARINAYLKRSEVA